MGRMINLSYQASNPAINTFPLIFLIFPTFLQACPLLGDAGFLAPLSINVSMPDTSTPILITVLLGGSDYRGDGVFEASSSGGSGVI